MELTEHNHQFSFENGFYYSQPRMGNGTVPNTARRGGGFWKRGQRFVSDAGHSTYSPSAGASLNTLQLVGANHGGVTVSGNITLHSNTTWAIGSGTAYVGGSALSGSVTSSLKLLVSGALEAAGLARPSAPTVTASATASSKMNGSYSICVAAYRSTTGAIGNRSLPSAVVAVKNKKLAVTLPATVTGQTHWLIYGSRRGFGSVGPWFLITSIAAVPVATTLLDGATGVEYFDGELGALAPMTNDVPPTGTHCAALGGVMCVIGSYGGYGVSPSKPGYPEAFDVSQTSFLASREPVTAVTARGTDGGIFVATRNSISLIILSGSDLTPVLPRGVFENVGVSHGNAMCWVYDTLYLFSSTGAACRTHGSEKPDLTFAIPVQDYFRDNGFTGANTRVIFDERNGCVLFCSGTVALPFMLDTETWSTPITLPGTVTVGIALGGSGLVGVGATLYTLDTAAGSPAATATLTTPYQYVGGYMALTREFRAVGHTLTLDLLTNPDNDASIGGLFPHSFTGPNGSPKVLKPQRRYREVALKVSTTAGGREFEEANLVSLIEPVAA
jgi:hypothetical protein